MTYRDPIPPLDFDKMVTDGILRPVAEVKKDGHRYFKNEIKSKSGKIFKTELYKITNSYDKKGVV